MLTAAQNDATKIFDRALVGLILALLCLCLCACSPRLLLVRGIADELSSQSLAAEDDLLLAREASAFYLKLSESVLRQSPGHIKLAESVASGFTQYAFAFVAFEAEKIEARDAAAAQLLRERAARLYRRAQRHALAALEHHHPGFMQALTSTEATQWPHLTNDQIGLAYWTAASWGGLISLSKDDPETVADWPLAFRLAQLAWSTDPTYGDGALASLMGSFEAARPGGSRQRAQDYFDQAMIAAANQRAGVFVAKAEALALPAGDRTAFETLLRQALAVSAAHPDLQNAVMRERAQWLLGMAPDFF